MSQLKPCPCGEIPKTLCTAIEGIGSKWGYVCGNCCAEWNVEFRTQYETDHDKLIKLATQAWNEANRGNSNA